MKRTTTQRSRALEILKKVLKNDLYVSGRVRLYDLTSREIRYSDRSRRGNDFGSKQNSKNTEHLVSC